MRAAVYVRQSLDRTGDELGVQRQEEECRRLCASRGYEVVELVQDNNRSATTGERPGYQRLLGMIESKAIDVVVVLRVDRLLRRLTELESLIDLSERTGVVIVTVQGEIDLSTSQGRLVGRVLASVARAEAELKGERHRLANAQKARSGKPHGSRRPYGYEADLVTIYEPEAAILREMARKVINNHTYKEVSQWLNRAGYRTTLGKPWYPVTVRNMLLKKRYAGVRDYKGTEYPATWQPIFDAETWDRLQLTMRLRSANNVPKSRKYLLTGLVQCGNCGAMMTGSTKVDHPGRPQRRIYQCNGEIGTDGTRGCRAVSRNASALDWWVTEAVFARLETPELASLLTNDDPAEAELKELLFDHDRQIILIGSLIDDYATGVLSRDQLVRAKTTAEAELARIETEIDRLSRRRHSIALPVGQTLRQAWEASDSNNWRRALIGLLVKRVIVNKGITKPFMTLPDGAVCRFDPSLIEVVWIC